MEILQNFVAFSEYMNFKVLTVRARLVFIPKLRPKSIFYSFFRENNAAWFQEKINAYNLLKIPKNEMAFLKVI